MIETYKLMTGKYDHKIVNFMPKQHDSSTSLPTRGHQLKLYRQRAEKNLWNNFFSLRVTSYWNSLPDNVVQSPNIKTLESRLDQHWRNMKENTTLEVPTAPLLTEGQNMKKPLKKKEL